jgi:hypothetical protein
MIRAREPGLFEQIRAAAAEIAERARQVHIDPERLEALAGELRAEALEPVQLDPAHHYRGSPESTLAFVVTLDAVNFGSGWFPLLEKRPGLSGYFTLATSLREHFEAEGAWSAAELASLRAEDCSRVFGQDPSVPEVMELMDLFARALRDLGCLLQQRYRGGFDRLVSSAQESAEQLVVALAQMPFYRDVARYDEIEAPFYKRAQLTAADLAVAFQGRGFGRFRDLDSLTIFADNLVPHVLRCEGVLAYGEDLGGRIEAGLPIPAGSPEEVEIRAVALHAVEQMVASIRARGAAATAHRLDYLLWNRGQRPEIKAHPRHRTRSVYY